MTPNLMSSMDSFSNPQRAQSATVTMLRATLTRTGDIPADADISPMLATPPLSQAASSISHELALKALKTHAMVHRQQLSNAVETVPLTQCIGRITAEPILSPISTPRFDTSAMDGYAIRSACTRNASPDNPLLFTVVGTMAAGDPPKQFPLIVGTDPENCVEIMTGARFPGVEDEDGEIEVEGWVDSGEEFDACVKFEDVIKKENWGGYGMTVIEIRKPVARHANRRFAGADYKRGEVVVPKGVKLQSQHLMALASVGIEEVQVLRRLKLGVWSTGKELTARGDRRSRIADVNGPYLTATLQAEGLDAEFVGVVGDNEGDLRHVLEENIKTQGFDVLISSAGVSKGKFDFVRSAVDAVGDVVFHGVSMRPGHPVLFANVGLRAGSAIPLFALPGNPVAAAVCLKFVVLPYIRALQDEPQDTGVQAKLRLLQANGTASPPNIGKLDVFRHGTIKFECGALFAEPTPEQSPAKIKPMASSSCWIHLAPGASNGSLVRCFPTSEAFDFV